VCGLPATKEQEKIDVLQLHRLPVLTEEIMVDDGHSKFPLSVYRVEEHRKVAVDASDFGHFFDGVRPPRVLTHRH
jgi:hypothetical protein